MDMLPILAPSTLAVTYAGLGLIPVRGPTRALTFGLSKWVLSFFQSPTYAREGVAAEIKEALAQLLEKNYLMITGPKGVGKTEAINRALRGTCYVRIPVAPGAGYEAIVAKTRAAICRNVDFINPPWTLTSVLFFYRIFRRRGPVVVFELREVTVANSRHAEIAGAARAIADAGCRVILDSSPNSLEAAALSTGRENKIHVDAMSRSEVEQDKQFGPLLDVLKNVDLDDTIWAVTGGNAARLYKLTPFVKSDSTLLKKNVWKVAQHELTEAGAALAAFREDHPHFEDILKEIADNGFAPLTRSLPHPNKVLRSIEAKEQLIPASPAMELTIRLKLNGSFVEALSSLDALSRAIKQK